MWTCSSCGRKFETKSECCGPSCEEFDSEEYEYRNDPRSIYTVDGVGPADSFELLGKAPQIRASNCWDDERGSFTPWLADNPEPLEMALDTRLHDIETEVPAGRYRADIVAENTKRERVVIENQMGTSDHAHLGKLLTYGSYFNADSLVWIAQSFSKGHIRTAIEITDHREDIRLTLITFDVAWVGEYSPIVTFDSIWGDG